MKIMTEDAGCVSNHFDKYLNQIITVETKSKTKTEAYPKIGTSV